jgi:hypothetical protein
MGRPALQADAVVGAPQPFQPVTFGELGPTQQQPLAVVQDYDEPQAVTLFAFALKHLSLHNRALTDLELELLSAGLQEQANLALAFDKGATSHSSAYRGAGK